METFEPFQYNFTNATVELMGILWEAFCTASNGSEDAAKSEKSQAVYYISSCHMLIDKALSSDKPNGHWFEADWLHCKRDALSSNRKVDGSRLTGSTEACHS